MTTSTESLFTLLADATRRRILVLLMRRGELCVCEITAALGLVQPRVSSHLALLRKAGLVRARREGLWVHYSIDPGLPEWAQEVLHGLTTGSRAEATHDADEARLLRECPAVMRKTEGNV